MKKLEMAVLALLVAPAMFAAGTLTPTGSSSAPIQITKHTVDVVIDSGFARTEVNQTFFNPNPNDLEAVYGFPVPAGASLSEITIWNGENVLNGEVIESAAAKLAYQEERDAGHDAGLGECSCTKAKDGVEYMSYKFSVSPIRAQSEVRIRFVYYQALTIDSGIGRYVYPLAEGGTDDGANSFWTRNRAVEQHFAVNVELRSGWPVDEIRVPGAEAEARVNKLGAGHYKVALERTSAVLDRDFVFYYRLAENLPARVELLTYKPNANQPGTFMLTVTPGDDLAPITSGADYIFVLDVSGSMADKLPTLARGVQQVLGRFTSRDRFRVFLFNDHATELTNGFVNANSESVAEWSSQVQRIASNGGTNVYAGLQAALNVVEADRATSILLVTDGVANEGIVDPGEFQSLLKKYDVRVFGFLMGNNANWPLMRLIAESSGGFYSAVSNEDDIGGQILLAKSKITSEALHDAKLTIDGIEVFDKTDDVIGKIYRGQQLVIFGRYAKGGPAHVKLQARLTGQDRTYETTFRFPDLSADHPELERLWALDRIEHHILKRNAGVVPAQETEQAIRELGLKYQLVTDYTSMVVLSHDGFNRRGIARSNEDRVAAEHAAQSARLASSPAPSTPADQSQPMFSGQRSPSIFSGGGGRKSGGGAFDPFTALLALVVALTALKFRQ